MRNRDRNILLFTLLILVELGVLPEMQSIGFYCGDPKISHKYNGDTISLKALLTSTIFLPLLVMCGVEYSCYGTRSFAKQGDSWWAWWPQSLAWYREYLSGLLLVFFLTCVFKVMVGEPRPHFLDTCRPFQALNCTSGYVPSYTCTNSEISNLRVRDASKSFPSGHASLTVYLFTFSSCYLQRRVIGVRATLVAWLQLALLAWALACSFTRVTDRRHHWWDVLAGDVLGALVGLYTIRYFCCNFQDGTYRSLDTYKASDREDDHSPLPTRSKLLTTQPRSCLHDDCA